MFAQCPFVSRSTLRHIYMATAVLSLAVWLFMAAAETSPTLHAWLHGGAIPDDDDCAIVAVQHGKADVATVVIAPVVAVGIALVVNFVFSVSFIASLPLPDVRGPPLGWPATVRA
jgi:hypothetical protein